MSSLSAAAPLIEDDLDSVEFPPEVSSLTDRLRSAHAPSPKQVEYGRKRSHPTRHQSLDMNEGNAARACWRETARI
jgi:hypothetical protein